jgi:16S rRNA (cytidine1402-2'-O)-methyltransferase
MDEESKTAASFAAFGLRAEAEPIRPGLHVVATPIGNLGDISFRALATLAAADLVVAEDTRVTKTLLAHYGITTPLFAYHEHNADSVRPQLIARLVTGQALALVSDAGTPLISDPGFRLVGEALKRDIAVTSIPGASAVLAALVVAGLPTSRFFFEGFLPPKSAARRQRIAELAAIPGTLVFARELTKMFEAVRRGTLPALAAELETGEPLRGEIVVLVGPPQEGAPLLDGAALDKRIETALATLSVKDAASVVAGESGQPRRKIYARAVELAAAHDNAAGDATPDPD